MSKIQAFPGGSGTTGGGGTGATVSFTTIQPDAGTSPVADSASDTLTLTSSDGSILITGNSGTDTIDFVATGVGASGGITRLNGLTQPIQSFDVGTAGSSFNIVSTGSTHVFNIPYADASHNGLLSSANFSTFNNKQNALSFGPIYTGTAGVTISGGSLSTVGPSVLIDIVTGSTSVNGLIGFSDFIRFNNKQSALTFGNVYTSTTGVSVGGGALSTVGPSVSIDIQTASGSQPGLLSSADWIGFNSKQAGSSNLTALAALGATGFVVEIASASFVVRTITGVAGEIAVTNGDGAAGNPSLGVGSSVVTVGSSQLILNKIGYQFGSVISNGNSGQTLSINWATGQVQSTTVNATLVSFVMSGATLPCMYQLQMTMGVTFNTGMTFSPKVFFPTAVPIPTSTLNAIDFVRIWYDGATFYGSQLANFV